VASGQWLVDRKGYIVKWYAIVPAMFAMVAVATPWMFAHSPEVGLALQRGFAVVCHQQPERSFVMFGGSAAVCARCLGIYLGAAAGLFVRLPRRLAKRFLMVAVALNFVDWLAEFAGLHGNWMFVRFALGVVLGATGAMMVSASTRESPAPATLHR
jgi:uncharacterized membrane protein